MSRAAATRSHSGTYLTTLDPFWQGAGDVNVSAITLEFAATQAPKDAGDMSE
jgi:hypothetical protein